MNEAQRKSSTREELVEYIEIQTRFRVFDYTTRRITGYFSKRRYAVAASRAVTRTTGHPTHVFDRQEQKIVLYRPYVSAR